MPEKPLTQTANTTAANRQDFIGAMRNIASSITVVTTQNEMASHGATVSAFNSVSADPPCVLICLKTDSRIAQSILKNKNYCVNVMPLGASDIADRFAGRHDDQVDDRFDGIACQYDEISGPVLAGSDAFLCTLEDSHDVGSHTVFFGNVIKMVKANRKPLIWLDGQFCQAIPYVSSCPSSNA